MTVKAKALELIPHGFNDEEIAFELGSTRKYISNVRAEYNLKNPHRYTLSVRRKPLAGTGSRRAFEYMLSNPHLTMRQVSDETGVDVNTCRRMCKIYMPRLAKVV
jgi:hypothetical protein